MEHRPCTALIWSLLSYFTKNILYLLSTCYSLPQVPSKNKESIILLSKWTKNENETNGISNMYIYSFWILLWKASIQGMGKLDMATCQNIMCMWLPGGSCSSTDSHSTGLWWSLRVCISNKLQVITLLLVPLREKATEKNVVLATVEASWLRRWDLL